MKHFNPISSLCTVILISLFISASADGKRMNRTLSDDPAGAPAGIDQPNTLQTFSGTPKELIRGLLDEEGKRIFGDEDPAGDFIDRKVMNGHAGSSFGRSVSSAGDVNGDGYDDFVVGAFTENSEYGKAYIYFGGANINLIPDVIITGETADSRLGHSVGSANDLNADGYDDVIIGAFGYNGYSGRAYIHFGGPNMDNIPDITLSEGTYGDYFGFCVNSAGDFNGDGFMDAAVGLTGYSTGGRVYIYYGGLMMDSVSDFVLTGETMIDNFGVSVSAADVNGDGFTDLAVGALQYNSYQGRAYVYFGGPLLDNTADVTMTGETANSSFGYVLTCAGDINGDGIADIAAGAHEYNSFQGKAYLFYGGSNIDNTADVILTGASSGLAFARYISYAGDINGDGFSDLAVGAPFAGSNTGEAYIFFGGANMNTTADITLHGETANSYFGECILSGGDLNGDGYPEILAGAFGYNSSSGRVYLYDYFPKGELYAELTMTGEGVDHMFGISVSDADDVNADGFDDIIVGAMQPNYSETGKAYVFFGSPNTDGIPDLILSGEYTGDRLGYSVSSAGDVNNDGYSDVIVGAIGYSGYTGRAYIYLGGYSPDNVPDVILTGQAANNHFGMSVSGAGDVNGDGYSDVIVGAPILGGSYEGRAYIYYGGASMDNSFDVYMTGEGSSYQLGISVGCAGDMNGDGYSDVIAGAPGYNSNQGRVTVYFGGTNMNGTPDLYLYGETTSSVFGYSVSGAGNVNGDAYDDVIVGSYGYGGGLGRAYIYYGGINPNSTADVVMEPPVSGSYFGISASPAGDLNFDGYSDVIVGAHNYSLGTGRAYIYYGGMNMNSTADLYISGEMPSDYLGYVNGVSGAGDLNGDGYADIIAGAHASDANGSNSGKSYVYYGSAISAKPILLYVKDVPNDQGGKVNLKWARSSYDNSGTGMITDYLVQRSYPPSGGNYSWENIASIPATREPFYTYTANTPFDSSSNNSGNFFFRITARTSNPDQYWRSAILSGRSTDNLAPPMVSPFSAVPVSGNVRLTWGHNTAPDLRNYMLYRSTSPTIDPDTEPVFATTTDVTYTDASPLGGLYYYFIVAQDVHYNKSPVAVTGSPAMSLNLTVFIAGLYNEQGNSQTTDTIIVELRNSTPPYSLADQSRGVVSQAGILMLRFGTAPEGNYYFAVKHRNSIETWNSAPLAFSRSSATVYDMSVSASQAYGSNMMQIDASPLRFGIYSGDVNGDGLIDATDAGSVDSDAGNYVSGYVPTDLNGDGFVDGTDFLIADNNAANFISVIRP